MTLKQEIETTIAAYKEACKIKNLNFNYCVEHQLSYGICYFASGFKFLPNLFHFVSNNTKGSYLCNTPTQLFIDLNYNKVYFLKITYKIYLYQLHQIRLKYLQNLLKSLPNDRTN
jgi:hypothetical protein